MPKLFQAELQIIGDDNETTDNLQQKLESKLSSFGSVDVFVRETNYIGNLDEGLKDFENEEDEI